ncbi:inositol 2-dehydrogenase [Candidatus Bipolaricaulota bacterium]|nr:inositol 2-dehydrogenase [Candidatus Bipolaricaulota bacterium]
MGTLKLALIGAGRIGRLHAENLRRRLPDAEVVAVVDVVEEAARKLAAELGIPHAYGDPAPIFEDPKIEAVLICSSTDTHAQFIEQAAQAGKHVFCEKPIALDLERIDRALAAVEQAGVILQVGFNRRFDPSFAEARRLVQSGAIGKPHVLRITSRDPAPPAIEYIKVSGGIFLDMTIHDFDMARFLLGEEVVEVFATGAVLVDPKIGEAGDIDTAVVNLRFESGALGVIDNSRKAVYGYDQRVEVFGEQGMIRVENPKPHQAVMSNADGDHAPPLLHFFLERYTDSYVRELEAFLASIREGKEPQVTGRDGKIPVVIGYAAKRSLAEGRPVRPSEIDPSLA